MSDIVAYRTLVECEADIEEGAAGFVKVGTALAEIRAGKLYQDTHETFEDYCLEKWGLGRSYAYYQIAAASVSTIVDVPNEAVARELVPLRDEPQRLEQVWRDAVGQFGAKPTASQVRQLRNGAKPKIHKVECPTCGSKVKAEIFGKGDLDANHP